MNMKNVELSEKELFFMYKALCFYEQKMKVLLKDEEETIMLNDIEISKLQSKMLREKIYGVINRDN
jgi:hypothetical protein